MSGSTVQLAPSYPFTGRVTANGVQCFTLPKVQGSTSSPGQPFYPGDPMKPDDLQALRLSPHPPTVTLVEASDRNSPFREGRRNGVGVGETVPCVIPSKEGDGSIKS